MLQRMCADGRRALSIMTDVISPSVMWKKGNILVKGLYVLFYFSQSSLQLKPTVKKTNSRTKSETYDNI